MPETGDAAKDLLVSTRLMLRVCLSAQFSTLLWFDEFSRVPLQGRQISISREGVYNRDGALHVWCNSFAESGRESRALEQNAGVLRESQRALMGWPVLWTNSKFAVLLLSLFSIRSGQFLFPFALSCVARVTSRPPPSASRFTIPLRFIRAFRASSSTRHIPLGICECGKKLFTYTRIAGIQICTWVAAFYSRIIVAKETARDSLFREDDRLWRHLATLSELDSRICFLYIKYLKLGDWNQMEKKKKSETPTRGRAHVCEASLTRERNNLPKTRDGLKKLTASESNFA